MTSASVAAASMVVAKKSGNAAPSGENDLPSSSDSQTCELAELRSTLSARAALGFDHSAETSTTFAFTPLAASKLHQPGSPRETPLGRASSSAPLFSSAIGGS